MIKECTPEVANDFSQKVLTGEIDSLVISKEEDGKYYANYMLRQPEPNLQLSNTLYASDSLKEFASLLSVSKVADFYYSFVPNENKCVVNKAYTADAVITRDVILKSIVDNLKNTLTLVKEIEIHDVKVSTLYEKIDKSGAQSVNVVNNTQRNQKDNRPRYQEATVESIIEKFLEVLA